jgi:hydroxymethylbilane synthase
VIRQLRLASRGSALALAQSRWVAGELARIAPALEVELSIIHTTGDRVQDVALHQVGGKGLFTKEIEEALLRREADLAVHSLKDLPVELPEGPTVGAYTASEDPRDAIVSRGGIALAALVPGARVGTSSLRRIAQLRAHRPDLVFESVRGNVDTRLTKLETEGWDAMVLAGAGLVRLGLEGRITEWLPTSICTPAAGQGMLAIEIRAHDPEIAALVAGLEPPESRIRAEAERSAMSALGGGCRTPMGFLATVEGDRCRLEGMTATGEGEAPRRETVEGPASDPVGLGLRLADRLLRGHAD